MDNKFNPLECKDDVLSIENFDRDRIILNHPMFKVRQFTDEAERLLMQGFSDGRQIRWFIHGVDCELLKLGAKKWQKGKVKLKITLEFCSDEPEIEEKAAINPTEISELESPLDDIRRQISENSQ